MSRHLSAACALLLCFACDHTTPVEVPPPPPPENRFPTANIGGPYAGVEGAAITFTGRSSTDPDGDSLAYQWTLEAGKPDAVGVTAVHVYSNNGVYPLVLVVRDSHGASDTATAEVSVSNAAPEIDALTTPTSPLPLGSAASVQVAFADPGSADTLTATIDWGDGHATERTPVGVVTHAYATAGEFVVRLTVRDDDGGETTRSATNPITIYDPNANQAEQAGYEVIDLGTLGGNTSLPLGLNDLGQVVGISTTADGQRHAFLWDNGIMRDLAPDLAESKASMITNSGLIAGLDLSGPPLAIPAYALLAWNNGVRTRLGNISVPGDGRVVEPVGMTEAGDIVAWQGSDEHVGSAIWQRGAPQPLGGLGEQKSAIAHDVNALGQIVGGSMVKEYAGSEIRHAFLWDHGAMHDLGLLRTGYACGYPDDLRDCGRAEATGINNRSEAVGWSSDELGTIHAVLWANEAINDLGHGQAVAINDRGDILWYRGEQSVLNDWGLVGTSGANEATFWRDGQSIRLGSLGGGETNVVGLNGQSQVAGSSKTVWGATHVFVWEPGKPLVDLGVGPREGQGRGARPIAINARGDIVGYSFSAECVVSFDNCWGAGTTLPTRAILWRRKGS